MTLRIRKIFGLNDCWVHISKVENPGGVLSCTRCVHCVPAFTSKHDVRGYRGKRHYHIKLDRDLKPNGPWVTSPWVSLHMSKRCLLEYLYVKT